MGRIGKLVKSVLNTESAAFENKVGLSQEKLEALQRRFEALHGFGGDLHDRLLRYVLDDVEDGAPLEELASQKEPAAKLGLGCASQYGGMLAQDKSWAGFLATIELIDASFYLRLGKVFEAAARNLPADRFFCQAEFDGALWLEILLQEGTHTDAHTWSSAERKTAISGPLVEAMLKADGREIDRFLAAPFRVAKSNPWLQNKLRSMVLRIADLGTMFAMHRDLIVPFLNDSRAENRLVAVENLARAGAPAKAFIAELVAAATCDSKRVREAAEALLAAEPAAAQPLLETIARDGSRNERQHAVRLLGSLCRVQARSFLDDRLASETSAPVRELIESVLNSVQPSSAPAGSPLQISPHLPLPPNPPVTAALRTCLEKLFAEYNDHARNHNERFAQATRQTHIDPRRKLDPLSERDLDEVCKLLQDGGAVGGHLSQTLYHSGIHFPEPKGALKAFLEHPDCQLAHVVRLLAMINDINRAHPHRGDSGMSWHAGLRVSVFRRSHEPKITLRHVADALREAGFHGNQLATEILGGYQRTFDWEPEAVWPFFAERLERLEKTFEPAAGDWSEQWQRKKEFDSALWVLGKFPQVPPSLTGKLWDLAIGTVKADRVRAQPTVERLPDLFERLTKALAAGNYQTRVVAAEWLSRLGDQRAVAVLDAAARQEKHDAALDEILTALEKLGQTIEPYLNRQKLQSDADKGLKKGIPEALAWFPWTELPKVHWNDNGETIPSEVVTWLIVQNFKLKSPEAGPLLRRYCELIVPAEREELGRYVLAAWLERDLVRKHTDAEARTLAHQQAPQMFQTYQQLAQHYQQQNQAPPASYPQNLQQVEELLFHSLCRECAGSAIAVKGILAVAGACGNDSLVAPVQKYLKEWYGYRAAQCKALIAMLSVVDHPAAIQYLLSIANRFRTKGIREEAEKHVKLIADRKNWTLDELADRTMPTAGFDDEGTLDLIFGPRVFTARVNTDLEAVLSDATGKVLKGLPDPRQDDDAELAKAAKATFSSAKKELKGFSGMQTTRLYEAMCTQRTWPAADWRMYLLRHPLLKFLCQRLVWAVCSGDEVQATFRPLDDGSLSDFEDGEVVLDESALVRIAHGCQLPDAVAEAWKKHLADYDVSPLFTQFGRAPYKLPGEKRNDTAIDDFRGHLVEAFKLRGLATKIGYTRGQAEDGGWFYQYQKSFPGLGLIAQLCFSGNGLPEENRTVALTELSFQKSAPREAGFTMQGGSRPLGKIPAVLLTECYNDLAAIAKTGSGFDPDWEKKVY